MDFDEYEYLEKTVENPELEKEKQAANGGDRTVKSEERGRNRPSKHKAGDKDDDVRHHSKNSKWADGSRDYDKERGSSRHHRSQSRDGDKEKDQHRSSGGNRDRKRDRDRDNGDKYGRERDSNRDLVHNHDRDHERDRRERGSVSEREREKERLRRSRSRSERHQSDLGDRDRVASRDRDFGDRERSRDKDYIDRERVRESKERESESRFSVKHVAKDGASCGQ
ncbi:DEAD-box ATP-dependent RNA helicase 21-like isoform X2 [Gastrolobium bilobum]|uniref:DEAD-box ATP-dependent RNA helicase 21-like isoform X2 n=1 Tax=Gastrolobium bilobum TaxID=150636 RepID=UPI002AB2D6C2|nr:DEAD-box ATP-dependent RNA helicase 21-like isoform X2 [Gastrolobium bilobum]